MMSIVMLLSLLMADLDPVGSYSGTEANGDRWQLVVRPIEGRHRVYAMSGRTTHGEWNYNGTIDGGPFEYYSQYGRFARIPGGFVFQCEMANTISFYKKESR
jgi:hypothetical protein